MLRYHCQQCGVILGDVTEEPPPACPDHPDSPVEIIAGEVQSDDQ